MKKILISFIIGKTNIGKSTLFNKLIKKKISITSKKKNTTIENILGIINKKNKQYIFIDTPGINNKTNIRKYLQNIIKYNKINLINNKINLFLILIENLINYYEIKLIDIVKKTKIPFLIIINKTDKIKKKEKILKTIKLLKNNKINNIFPINLKQKKYLNLIKKNIKKYLVKNKKFIFNKKIISNKKKKYIINEIVREKIYRLIGDEIPYKLKFKTYIKKIKNIYFIINNIITYKKQYIKILKGKNKNRIKKIYYLCKKNIKKYLKNKKIKLNLNIKFKKKNKNI